MKLFAAVLFTLLSFSFANAQSYFTLSGKIVNAATKEPMKDASVFAQNTTMGTVTDADGNFKIALPNGGYDLVITYTGFQTESRRITTADAAEPVNIYLKEKEKELEVVSVASSNEVKDGLAKYGAFFNEEFIGKTPNGKQTSIQNPEVLHFFFSKKRNRLKITATEPLIIKNEALGYNIKYTIDSFTHEYATQVSTYTGYPLFEEMTARDDAQKLQWEAARRAAYKGSMLNFMRAVYAKELKPQEFEIQFLVKTNGKESAIKLADPYPAINYDKDDSTQVVEIQPNQNNVGVLFSGEKPSENYLTENPSEPKAFQFSLLNFKPGESIVIEQNGYFYDQNDIAVSGYWAWDKVADQLPYDYHYLQQ
jgi:hypothetical protein